jgi:hypothetical protein
MVGAIKEGRFLWLTAVKLAHARKIAIVKKARASAGA